MSDNRVSSGCSACHSPLYAGVERYLQSLDRAAGKHREGRLGSMRGRLAARRDGTKRNLYRRIADRISGWLILAFGSQTHVALFLSHVPEPDENWGS